LVLLVLELVVLEVDLVDVEDAVDSFDDDFEVELPVFEEEENVDEVFKMTAEGNRNGIHWFLNSSRWYV
jgi:hypothetical protein